MIGDLLLQIIQLAVRCVRGCVYNLVNLLHLLILLFLLKFLCTQLLLLLLQFQLLWRQLFLKVVILFHSG